MCYRALHQQASAYFCRVTVAFRRLYITFIISYIFARLHSVFLKTTFIDGVFHTRPIRVFRLHCIFTSHFLHNIHAHDVSLHHLSGNGVSPYISLHYISLHSTPFQWRRHARANALAEISSHWLPPWQSKVVIIKLRIYFLTALADVCDLSMPCHE